MNRCATCKYAIFDYTEYYGTTVKNWFVEDCRKSEDFTADECDEYEEYRMRPIDADALRDRLQSLAYDDWNQGVNTSWANAYNECADMVDDMPTIEPQRMRGKWIEPTEDNDYWECPVCHDTYELDVDVTPQDARMFFCPNCGADMRGTE